MTDVRAQTVQLAIMDSARAPTTSALNVHDLSLGERAFRALKRLAAGWGAALVCVFIPIVHFVAVPVLLVLGPILGFRAWRTVVQLAAGKVECPKCQAVAVVPEGTGGWPARLFCGTCGTTFDARPS